MSTKILEMVAFHEVHSGQAAEVFVDASAILASQGHATGLAGQVSLRDGDSTRMLTLRLGTGLEEASTDSLLLTDENLQTLEGGGRPNPGTRFHALIYRRHPQVRAIVHTHPPAISAFSILGIPLPVAHMDACMFHDDCGFLARWPVVPTRDEEGALISQALDGRRTAFLAKHGCVCIGQSQQ